MDLNTFVNSIIQSFGGIISLMILCFLCFIRKKHSRLDTYFIRFLIGSTSLLFCNLIAWLIDGNQTFGFHFLNHFINFLCCILHILLLGLFGEYINCYIEEKGGKCRFFRKALWMTVIVGVFFVVISQFFGFIFTINDDNVYVRGSFPWIFPIIGMAGLFINFVYILLYRKYFDKREYFAFLLYELFPLFGVALQMFFYGSFYLYLFIVFGTISLYIFVQSDQARALEEKERELQQQKITLMASQIRPHFLYNALVGIQQLCDDQEMVKASKAIESFAHYLRGNLEALSDVNIIPFKKEMEHVNHYLELEKMRFEERLRIIYDIVETEFFLPALSIQPIVENAVRHGLHKRLEGGCLWIQSKREANFAVITIEDNGVGFNTQEKIDCSLHIGLENVKKRIELICQGELFIHSEVGKGTRVQIRIPIQEEVE